jgi:hypothetical protein
MFDRANAARLSARHVQGVLTACLLCAALGGCAGRAASPEPPADRARLEDPLIVTQLPADAGLTAPPRAPGTLRADYGDGARLLRVAPDGSTRVLSRGFAAACDPAVSFDATRLLFAGKRKAGDPWNVFEMAADGSDVRQVTRGLGNCRSPSYQSTLYTIISPRPWYQLTFVSDAAGMMNEDGSSPATDLYSSKLDGSAVRRLTFNLSSDFDPFLMDDGRLLFAGWQRRGLERGLAGRVALFGINIDGADVALFADTRGRRLKHMPCTTAAGLAVFVETDDAPWDGAGNLACVRLRRPRHTYRPITGPQDGLFHSPSPLPDGRILVSRRPADGSGTHGVQRLDPATGRTDPLFDDPRFHDVQAVLVHPRREPDGRSSVVTEEDPYGRLYCLDAYLSDPADGIRLERGGIRRLRVLEGIPVPAAGHGAPVPGGAAPGAPPGPTANGLPPLVQRRVLGEIDIHEDGSFNLQVPADVPIELQTLDADGMALATCGWIWAKNHEPRGCIGCHEDPERTPPNRFVGAVARDSIPLTLPPERRRTVDFRRDVLPILAGRCASCHDADGPPPRLDAGPQAEGAGGPFHPAYASLLAPVEATGGDGPRYRYVDPGHARTSPLVWQVFGRNTSRPWDAAAGRPGPAPSACEAGRLTAGERRTLIEWIDTGALWDGIPGRDDAPGPPAQARGGTP